MLLVLVPCVYLLPKTNLRHFGFLLLPPSLPSSSSLDRNEGTLLFLLHGNSSPVTPLPASSSLQTEAPTACFFTSPSPSPSRSRAHLPCLLLPAPSRTKVPLSMVFHLRLTCNSTILTISTIPSRSFSRTSGSNREQLLSSPRHSSRSLILPHAAFDVSTQCKAVSSTPPLTYVSPRSLQSPLSEIFTKDPAPATSMIAEAPSSSPLHRKPTTSATCRFLASPTGDLSSLFSRFSSPISLLRPLQETASPLLQAPAQSNFTQQPNSC